MFIASRLAISRRTLSILSFKPQSAFRFFTINTNQQISSASTLPVAPTMTTTSNDMRALDPNRSFVRIKERVEGDDDDEIFHCDEEPHMLSPKLGFGYFPLNLGQRLQDIKGVDRKLEIVRKLGWGSNSSVWLARNNDETSTVKYVAAKVLTVNATAGVLKGFLAEVDSLKCIASADPNHPGFKHCIHLSDYFVLDSHHGPHICIITDVLASDLVNFRLAQPNRVFPVPITKRIIKQTLLALDYLHRKCGLIHTDVKPDNTLIYIEQSGVEISQVLKNEPSVTYEPRIELDLSPDPMTTVVSQPLPNLGLKTDASNIHICLSDVGSATSVAKYHTELVQPDFLRAPEVILGHPWSTPIDIWSVGCLVFEYLTGSPLFSSHGSTSLRLQDVHLQQIIELLGPLPQSFLQASARRAEYFDDDGSLLRIKEYSPVVLEEHLRTNHVIIDKDIPAIAAFIRRCLAIDPAARSSALDLLDDEWLCDA